MSLFASRRNTRTEEAVILSSLKEILGAVDVTGMTAWERARAVHGRSAAGLAEGEAVPSSVRTPPGVRALAPSVKSVAIPLFEREEAA